MTAKKKSILSIICIVSLICAITAGIMLSVTVQPISHVDEGVRLSNTDVTINAESSVRVDRDENGKPKDAPNNAVAISKVDELKSFIEGNSAYGYLTKNIEDPLDWPGVGSQQIFADGRTLDGNGYSIELKETSGGQNVGYKGNFDDPLETNDAIKSVAKKRSYGMLVDYNLGTIKNVKFIYNSDSPEIQNNSDGNALYGNYVGLVCGTNTGKIINCDLDVKGSFTYKYKNGQINDNSEGKNNRFATFWGGIAGRNAGTVSYITADYKGFAVEIYTNAQNQKNFLTPYATDEKASAGGIVGMNATSAARVSEIIIGGSETKNYSDNKNNFDLNVYFNVWGDTQDEAFSKGNKINVWGAVVGSASSWSGGVDATISNIFVDLKFTTNAGNNKGDESKNGVVGCGVATDVTILDRNIARDTDYETDNCGCKTGNNDKQHDPNYGNLVYTDKYTNVTMGFDDEANQVITVKLKEDAPADVMLGEVAFKKYQRRIFDKEEGEEDEGIDNGRYTGVPSNESLYIYNDKDARFTSYTFTVAPYQSTPGQYWEAYTYGYEPATVTEVAQNSYVYTGEDFLAVHMEFSSLLSDTKGIVNPEGIKAVGTFVNPEGVTTEDITITSGRLPGTYTYTLQEKEAGIAFVDTKNHVYMYTEEGEFTQYAFEVNYATINALNIPEWITEPTVFTFEIPNQAKDAVDGYIYTVNGSLPTTVKGVVMENRVDTTTKGRTYSVYLTSEGVQVTNEYTYTVKVDVNDPTLEIGEYEHPNDVYYAHNTVTLKATDRASGVKSIIMYVYLPGSNTFDHTHDIINDEDGKLNSVLNKDGSYTFTFEETGRMEIVVTDNVGHSTSEVLDVKIDKTKPTLDVKAYRKEKEESGVDDNDNPIYGNEKKVDITDFSKEINAESAIYFEVQATFGEAGGEIRYSLDKGTTWTVCKDVTVEGNVVKLNAPIVVKNSAKVKFRAVAYTYDHPEDDVAPYNKKYRLYDNWGDQTAEIKMQLKPITITLDDLTIEGVEKPFDGTNVVTNGTIALKDADGFIARNDIEGEVQITSVVYADVNAGDSVGLIISVYCTDDTKIMDNQINGATGTILKKDISVVIDSQEKIYGVSLPELTYTATDMIKGFEETVPLYVVKPDGYTGTYELLPQNEGKAGYPIKVVENAQLNNYNIVSVNDDATLSVNLAPIDRLVYKEGTFTGLDTKNIKDRNLEIGFTRSNGEYEKLSVTFYAYDTKLDPSTGEEIDKGYIKKVADITKAGAGFFKVVISLPSKDKYGESLSNKYVIDKAIESFMIKIIDASIFDVEDKDDEAGTDKNAQSVNNSSNAQVGIYDDNSTNTGNIDMAIESEQKSKDYIAMISIFCAVIIAVAFALGVGRAIYKRIKR